MFGKTIQAYFGCGASNADNDDVLVLRACSCEAEGEGHDGKHKKGGEGEMEQTTFCCGNERGLSLVSRVLRVCFA